LPEDKPGCDFLAMQKYYHFLLTTDDGAVRRWSCGRKRLMRAGIAATAFFVLFTAVGLRSATLSLRASGLQARAASLERQLAAKDAELVAQKRLDQVEKERLETKIAAVIEEKDLAMATAVHDLSARSALIDEVLKKIGFDLETGKTGDASENSGGPFVASKSLASQALINRADFYLQTMNKLPLGLPTHGWPTSSFGNRIDPLNGRRAFHTGMDFHGERNGEVFATADGIVKEADWNGSYGRYVEIDHQNGYSTAYAHLGKLAVEAGNHVQRGQVIGYIGSSGRSTGPHLHYELRYHNNLLDPARYVRVEETIQASKLKIRKR
jgi:murein DD-endopeptidase MepM/ murein hydrolase activator NlpD